MCVVEGPEGELCDFLAREADSGQSGLGKGAQLDVVEADERDVLWDTQAVFKDGPHGTDGGQIVGSDDSRRALRLVEQPQHGFVAAVGAVVALLQKAIVYLNAFSLHDIQEGTFANARGGKGGGAGDEANGGVAQAKQVFHGSINSSGIIYPDIADAFLWCCCVEKGEGDIAVAELFDKVLVHFGGHDGHAIYLALEHAAYADLGAVRVVIGIGDEHFLPVLHGYVFKALYQFGKEGICDV